MSATAGKIQVENVVASSDIGQELDLDILADDMPDPDYDPDSFPGIVYRMDDPRAAALIFGSGKVVCTGANSVENVKTALRSVFDTFRDLGINVSPQANIEIQNVVASGDLGSQLNLNAIAIGFGLEQIEYEPEQFPGLVYRLDEPDVVALLFGSGKLVITGGKDPADANLALSHVKERLIDLGLLNG